MEIFSLAKDSIENTNSIPGALFFLFPLFTAAKHLARGGGQGAHDINVYMKSVITDVHGFSIGSQATKLEKYNSQYDNINREAVLPSL